VAADISSAYTDFNPRKDCSIADVSGEEEGGDFARMICPGWKGYPVILSTGDLRESVFYGFPPAGELAWESFSAFNGTGDKIEWRIETIGEKAVPLAAIHRWFVSDPEDDTKKTEVLVVEKVGQVGVGDGCTVGLVVATGNPQANETARRIADESVRDFACGADERVLVSGDVPLPSFDRQEN
jgi:hypothetical protein